MNEPTKKKYSAPALDKGLDILELLSESRQPLTMGQIAEHLNRSKGEIFRMLVALEQRRYILRDEATDGFLIGNRLFEMAMKTAPTRDLVATAMPHISAVAHAIDQSCHLTVLSNTEIVVIARVEAPGELGFAVRLGYHRRVDQSTSGRVLAAFASPADRQRLIAEMEARYPDFDRADFETRVERVRKQGYEKGPSNTVAGVTDMGAPIIGETGWAVGSLVVPFILRDGEHAGLDDAVAMVVREAASISEELAVGMPNATTG
ncbi:IclR family transcriptional regulator [Erythrobacter sp.]|uniref:IclR family transcriptional regulator n=1 Tax=Erythrobacter sp. TaxID=1042 RepID=UPI001B14ACFC|nr:IclR family transcriptional regulator [Erythrobacter sp.]MBO6525417.1 IclR family transcriptional regulator [Erythrobacter sp.]MBO6529910.1 IclR family transcriptional regulator [Erythrobacter sp.]